MPGQGLPTFPVASAPRVADDVALTAPTDDSGKWVISAGATHYYRAGADLVELLGALDGRRGVDDIVAALGDRWSHERVLAGLEVARRMELLDGSDDDRQTLDGRRVKFVPPLTVQIALTRRLDRTFDALLAAARPLAALPRRPGLVVLAAVTVVAMICWAAQIGATLDALAGTLTIAEILVVLAVSLVGTAVHEFAHGLALKAQGGRVNRMGIMVFYLMPAFFCDISDAWTLPRPAQRVRVALAGITVQCSVFGITSIAAAGAWAAGADGIQRVLLLIALTNIAMALINLIPFVKLDGYIALMSWCDVNQLRERSMRLVSDRSLAILYGARVPPTPGVARWRWWYGAGCMIFPVVVIVAALGNWRGALAGLGVIGAVVLALVSLYLILVVGTLVLRGLRRARDFGAALPRMIAVTGAVVLALGAAALLIRTDETVDGSFVTADGTTYLVSTDAAVLDALRAGQSVALRENGIVLHRDVASGELSGDRLARDVPLTALLPVGGLDLDVPATWVRIDGVDAPRVLDGLAEVTVGRVSLARSLVDRFVWPTALGRW
ncbi:daptide biosynthesis intramembrane metalloprotease [Williamsia sp. MIQD14]|uniref:daptide biosynthesis intramembrane metalloprotease n=1 Tax=Williamsia sp. MIQD14 TaxID=3425703 RepID=UPI003DA0C52D